MLLRKPLILLSLFSLGCSAEADMVSVEPSEDRSELGSLEQEWCIGCQAAVSTPINIPIGYGLRPITETVSGQSTQFPACQGSEDSMPHACRVPMGDMFWISPPPTSWASWLRDIYNTTKEVISVEFENSGWRVDHCLPTYEACRPSGNGDYVHSEMITKPDISNSPHPLFKITLAGINNTTVSNIKAYRACEIAFDFVGPKGILNNGGHCTGSCVSSWDTYIRNTMIERVFMRAFSRCAGLGGDQFPIYEFSVGSNQNNCFAWDGFSCSQGGGDGLLRKEWQAAGWWSQRFYKNCLGNTATSCSNPPAMPGSPGQIESGAFLLRDYHHYHW